MTLNIWLLIDQIYINENSSQKKYDFLNILLMGLNIICIFIRVIGTIFILIFVKKYMKIKMRKNKK